MDLSQIYLMLTLIPSLLSLLFLFFFLPRERNGGQEVAAMFDFAEDGKIVCTNEFASNPIGVTRTCWHHYSKATQTWNQHLLAGALVPISTSPVSTRDICSNILPLTKGSLAMTLMSVRRTNIGGMGFYICVNSSTVNKLSKKLYLFRELLTCPNEFLYHSQSYKLSKWKICWNLLQMKFLFTFSFWLSS